VIWFDCEFVLEEKWELWYACEFFFERKNAKF
jgi:hypothetical protein